MSRSTAGSGTGLVDMRSAVHWQAAGVVEAQLWLDLARLAGEGSDKHRFGVLAAAWFKAQFLSEQALQRLVALLAVAEVQCPLNRLRQSPVFWA